MSFKRINLQSLVANAMGKLEVSLKVRIMRTKEKRNVDKVECYKVESCVLIAPIVRDRSDEYRRAKLVSRLGFALNRVSRNRELRMFRRFARTLASFVSFSSRWPGLVERKTANRGGKGRGKRDKRGRRRCTESGSSAR